MSNTQPVTLTSGAPKKLTWANIVGYGIGDACNNVGWQMMNMFLTTYYVYMGIDPIVVANIFLSARLLQAVIYIFSGAITDAVKPNKNGKFRRLVVIFALPAMISVALMYTIPPSSPMNVKTIWAIVTFMLNQIIGAIGGAPYGALLGAMTQDPNERQKLSTSRMIGSALMGAIFSFTLATRVNSMDPSKLFLPVVSVFCVFAFFGYVLMAKLTVEQYTVPKQEKVSVLHTLKVLFSNKALFVTCLASILMTNPAGSIAPIIAKQILTVGQPQLTDQVTFALVLVGALMGLIVTPFSPAIVRKIGKKNAWILGCAIVIIASVSFIFVSNAWVAVFLIAMNNVGIAIINPCVWVMQADSVQYYEYTTGRRNTEGAAIAALSFSRQVGGAINSWAGPALMALVGYQAGMNVVQDPSVAENLRLAIGIVPSVMFALSAITIAFYPITEKKFKEMTEELRKRHEAEDKAEADGAAVEA